MRDENWQRVIAAFEDGLWREKNDYRDDAYGSKETDARMLGDVMRLKKVLDECHPLTVAMLDGFVADRGLVGSVDDLLVYCGERPRDKSGATERISRLQALAVLRDLYPDQLQKLRGAKVDVTNGGYAFNPYIMWLGEYLMQAEDQVLPKGERRMSLNEACLAAWNATPPVARPRKPRASAQKD